MGSTSTAGATKPPATAAEAPDINAAEADTG